MVDKICPPPSLSQLAHDHHRKKEDRMKEERQTSLRCSGGAAPFGAKNEQWADWMVCTGLIKVKSYSSIAFFFWPAYFRMISIDTELPKEHLYKLQALPTPGGNAYEFNYAPFIPVKDQNSLATPCNETGLCRYQT